MHDSLDKNIGEYFTRREDTPNFEETQAQCLLNIFNAPEKVQGFTKVVYNFILSGDKEVICNVSSGRVTILAEHLIADLPFTTLEDLRIYINSIGDTK